MRVILTEKPSVARDIARCLGITKKSDGYFSNDNTQITWAFGHLVELKEPEEYDPKWKRWSLETFPIIPEKFGLRPKDDKAAKQQLDTIKKLFKAADEIICATDAGREGELIFRYITTWAQCTRKPFKRLWINSMTDDAIKQGFAKLEEGSKYDNLYKAAQCRSESDWIVGLNSTRLYTTTYGQNRILWSIGRVQTPVLAMIVQRDLEILHFVPKDFWELTTLYREVVFKYTKGRFDTIERANAILQKIQNKVFEITDIQAKKENVLPPLLFDLTELQKEMSKKYGFTAEQTLSITQALYEKKHLTYPRTDSRYLTTDMKKEIPSLLKVLAQIKADEIGKLDLQKLTYEKRFFDDKKVNDHHAIIPTTVLGKGLSVDESKVYQAVVTRLIAAFYPPCKKEVTTVMGVVENEEFKATGTVIKDPGWQILYGTEATDEDKDGKDSKEKDDKEQILPAFHKGEKGEHQPNIKSGKTTPPKHFNDATLLSMMETAGKSCEEEELKEALKNKGLGTPATRATIIETLIKRKYIDRQKKNLISTDSGKHLISLIPDERLKSADLTGEWEAKLKKIERGEYSQEDFMKEIIEFTMQLKDLSTKPNYDIQLLGHCPLCKREVIEGKKGYGCSGWKEGCTFVLWKESLGLTITKEMAQQILQNGQTTLFYSVKDEQETYDAQLKLDPAGTLVASRVEAQQRRFAVKTPITNCPLCAGHVIELQKSYSCNRWKEGCKMVIWKTIAGKNITLAMAKKLLTKGETGVLKGFVGKSGKAFDANLKLVDGKVEMSFEKHEK